jgi:hypothetical protein
VPRRPRLRSVPFGTVEAAEPDLDRGLSGVARLIAIRNQRAEAKRRNLTTAIVQDKPALPQILM